MKIHGLQKMTLLDFPGKVACTVFLGGCDLRCPFCHNAELIDGTAPAVMDETELLRFLEKRRGLLEGVAVTGGEPLLRGEELVSLAEKIRELGYPLKLDTNGTHPERLRRLTEAGLVSYVAMDIKNDPDRYAVTCGMESMDLGSVRESVSLLMEGKTEYEFRTTTVAELHDGDSFRKIGEWIRGAKRYYLQKFTDRDTVAYAGFHAAADDEMRKYLDIVRNYVPDAALRGVDD